MQETQEMRVCSLGQEDPLEEGTVTHSSVLAWRTPWTEEPGGLQSMESQRDMTETTEHPYALTPVLSLDQLRGILTKPESKMQRFPSCLPCLLH